MRRERRSDQILIAGLGLMTLTWLCVLAAAFYLLVVA